MVKEIDMSKDAPLEITESKKDKKNAKKDKADKKAQAKEDKKLSAAAKKSSKDSSEDSSANLGSEKAEMLRALLGSEFGKDSIYNANSKQADFIKVYTGIAELDYYTGGISLGRMIELVGASQGGKSTLAVIIAEAISKYLENHKEMSGPSLYLDGERTLSRAAIARLGVDPSVFEIKKFMTGEEALQSASIANTNNLVSSIVIDSIPTLMPEKGVGDDTNFSGQQMGNRAKLLSDNIVKLISEADVSGTTIIAVNQERKQLGTYGSPDKGAGGKALEYFVDTRIRLVGSDKLMSGKECVGRLVKVKLAKSKSRAPEKEFTLRFIFDTGFDKLESLVNLGVTLGLVTVNGAFYSFGDNQIKGKENLKREMMTNKVLHDELHGLVYGEIEKIEADSKIYDAKRLLSEATTPEQAPTLDFKSKASTNTSEPVKKTVNGSDNEVAFDNDLLG